MGCSTSYWGIAISSTCGGTVCFAAAGRMLDDVVAERILQTESGGQVLVRVGRPHEAKWGDDFGCPVEVIGLGDEPVRNVVYGVDSMQAILLATQFIRTVVQQSEVRCRWLGGQALGFPKHLPAGWGGAVDAELEEAVDAKPTELLKLHGPPQT